jgi:FG-GAP-like repeat/PASTA domain
VSARRCTVLLASLGAALALGAVAGAAGGSRAPSFGAPTVLAASLDPSSVAIGDLNGDGKPDLVIANSFEDSDDEESSGTVSIRLNRGDGTFKPRRDYYGGAGPVAVAIGDLNGDGKPDLATADPFAGSVFVLLNGGDGSFRIWREYETGDRTGSVAIGDLNGDGALDLAAAVAETDRVDVLLNKGDGSFEPPVAYITGDDPFEVAIGDLNGDGAPDLATANWSAANTVSVLLNTGNGAFAPKRDYPAGPEPVSVAIGDLNGDDKPDLAVSHFGSVSHANSVSILANDGAGGFDRKRDYTVAEGFGQIAIGDLNRDGSHDVVTADEDTDRLSVLVNNVDGSFQPSLGYPTGGGPRSVAIGDLDGDGRLDLVTAGAVEDESNSVTVLLNKPGRCNVQSVVKLTPAAARAKLAQAHCAVGKIRSAYSKVVRKGRVASQRPAFGAVLQSGGKVNLVISRGARR